MSDQDRFEHEVTRQLWEERQEWLNDPKAQQEYQEYIKAHELYQQFMDSMEES